MGIVYTVCNCLHAFLYVYISVCEVPNTSVLVQMGDGLESERMCVCGKERGAYLSMKEYVHAKWSSYGYDGYVNLALAF